MKKILLIALACAAAIAHAQTYPSKPIRFIVPFPPGGGTDTNSRALTQKIAKNTGWTFVIDNKPGAGGNIGADQAAKAPADGYTLVMGQTSNLAINPFLYAKPPFDAVRDFAPVALVSSVPLVIVVGARRPNAVPLLSMNDVIAAAKAAPERVTFASPGNGTVGHLAGELIARIAGVKLVHVPYKGAGPAVIDLLSGQVTVFNTTPPSLIQHVRTGRLKALAYLSKQRHPTMPEIPTSAESGLPGYEVESWFAVFAPAGTPRDIVERLSAEVARIVESPDFKRRVEEQGAFARAMDPKALDAYVVREIDQWGKVIRTAGITME